MNAAVTDPLDMAPLIGHLREAVRAWLTRTGPATDVSSRLHVDSATLARRAGLLPKSCARPEVVLAHQMALELGAPATASHSAVLLTSRQDLVVHEQVWRLGPDLDAVPRGSSLPFAQIVVLAVREGSWPDPFSVDTVQYLTHRLPGYTSRAIPGRLWVRVSDAARARGLVLAGVGASLIRAYLEGFDEVCAAEVVLATSPEAVAALAPVCLEAEVAAGRHRKLALTEDGELDCTELDCEACDEKPVCDGLRDMLGQRRRSA